MSIILAIETSSELASAALLHGNAVLVREAAGVQAHSHAILPMVQSLLAQAQITLAQCQAIAFGSGPGSFTGVRTACGIAQGLGFGAGLPLVPVVTLAAMAQACREHSGADDVLALLDARMNQVYWAQYRYDQATEEWQVVVEPTLSDAAQVQPQGKVVACGNGLVAYADDFAGQPDFCTQKTLALAATHPAMPHALQIARLGRNAFLRGRTVAASDARPLYLRNKIALTSAEREVKMGKAAT